MNEKTMLIPSIGWRGIGRSLVIVTVGSEAVTRVLHRDPDVVVIHFDRAPKNPHELRAFSPSVVDVAVLDATLLDVHEMSKLAQSLRHRLLASVLVLPGSAVGDAMFRRRLGVLKEQSSPWVRHLWMAIAVAAQETWALGWVTMTRDTAKTAIDAPATRHDAPATRLDAPRLDDTVRLPRPPSRTAPCQPTSEMLAELTQAYNE